MFCPRCGNQLESNKLVCENCGYAGKEMMANCGYSMKWYNFLVKFLLIFTAVIYGLNALGYLTGTGIYQNLEYDQYLDMYTNVDVTAEVYELYPGLRGVDIVMGLVYAAFVVGYVLVRNKLKSFDKQAPKLLILLFAIEVVVAVAYAIVVEIVGVEGVFMDALPSIVFDIVYLALNYVYFKKRKCLFSVDEKTLEPKTVINCTPTAHSDTKSIFRDIDNEVPTTQNNDEDEFFK